MVAIGLFLLQYLLGNYAVCVNAKLADLQDDVRGDIRIFKGTYTVYSRIKSAPFLKFQRAKKSDAD